MEEIYEFLKKCDTYFLATIEDNQPHVRPFGTIDLFGGRLYIQTGKVKKVSRQMKENSHIEICGMYQGKWIRISAKAILDDNIEAQKHMLDAYPSLKNLYQAGDGNTEVFYLKDGVAQINGFQQETKTINF